MQASFKRLKKSKQAACDPPHFGADGDADFAAIMQLAKSLEDDDVSSAGTMVAAEAMPLEDEEGKAAAPSAKYLSCSYILQSLSFPCLKSKSPLYISLGPCPAFWTTQYIDF